MNFKEILVILFLLGAILCAQKFKPEATASAAVAMAPDETSPGTTSLAGIATIHAQP